MDPTRPAVCRPSREDPLVRSASEAVGGPSGAHALGHPWWTPLRVILAVACLAWLLAMGQKGPCAADGWSGEDTRYAQLCYSDLPYLYVGRGFAELAVPYADSEGRYPDLEYPVMTGLVAYLGAVGVHAWHGWPDRESRAATTAAEVHASAGVDEERQDYFWVTALLLAPFLLAAAFFLAGAHRGRPWDAMGFAAAPLLVLTGLINWDVVAVACTAGALWAWSRGRPVLAGVLVGVGAATKLYPLFLLGAFLVAALRRTDLGRFGAALGGAVTAWVAANLPVWLYGFDGWLGFWTFNTARGPDLGSLWLAASQLGHAATAETVNLVSWLVFAALCAAVLVLGLLAREVPRVAQLAFLVVAAFLLVNKVYSPQYVLWLLPLAVLARPRWRDLLIWQAGEAVYFVMVWMYLGGYTASATAGGVDTAYLAAIVVRVAAELYLVAVVVRDIVRPQHDPVRAAPDHDPLYPGTDPEPAQDTTIRSKSVIV